ncbi:MAG: AMP-binding protein [Hyphomicrobiaceae bacterium]|nr:AMP-binding protein [Hyphomicrobiaceae bacterium]
MSAALPAADTFPKLLLHHARQRGSSPATREKSRGIWRTLTWRELADDVAAVAAALSARGLHRGARMAFIGDNRPRLHVTMCAAHALGAVVVPLFQDATAEELLTPLRDAGVTHVFAEDQEQVDKILALLPRCPAIVSIVHDKDRGMRHYQRPQLVGYAALLGEGRAVTKGALDFLEAEAARGSGTDEASIIFTPGATGPSKGVVLTHAALIDRARAAAEMDGLTDADLALVYLPPAWIGQSLFGYAQPLLVGYCICCPESTETMYSDIREIGPTYFLAPPSVLDAMLKRVSSRMEGAGGLKRLIYRQCMSLARYAGPRLLSGERVIIGSGLAYGLGGLLIYGPLRDVLGLSRVRVAYSAGDAISPEVLTFFRAIGVNLKQLYGTAETGFFVAMQRDGAVRPDTVGPAARGVELRLATDREIQVRSTGLFKKYLGDPEATARAVTGDGWFRTGDAGRLTDDGQLLVLDRIKNIGTLADGTTFAPQAIENLLKSSPYIRQAVAFGTGRGWVCALIDIDTAAVGSWANKQAISYTGHADLASRAEVYRLVGEAIGKVNAGLARDVATAAMQIRRFAILPKELDSDDGELTRMRTLRRDAVAERYRGLVDAIYQGASAGPVGLPALQIRIEDAKPHSPATMRSAA